MNWKKFPYRTRMYSSPPQSMLPRCEANLSKVGLTNSSSYRSLSELLAPEVFDFDFDSS
jgi:hypothetical protein